jgi:hypothetical protein
VVLSFCRLVLGRGLGNGVGEMRNRVNMIYPQPFCPPPGLRRGITEAGKAAKDSALQDELT